VKKTALLAYGGIAYLLAMANIAYIVGFLADFGVPKTVAAGPTIDLLGPDAGLGATIALDAALVLIFGLHHSITARRWFKRWWTRFVPAEIERATYLYMTAVMTALLVLFWRPIPETIWRVDAVSAQAAIYAVYLSVWAMMFSATFHFGHFGFFGLAQVWNRITDRAPAEPAFAARFLYALVRHPISLGWMTVPWITPHMTTGQLVFALASVAYVLAATPFEEADLIAELGDVYRRYRKSVPAFLPGRRAR
jgi:protein-S-isoprenylcysteine O-methyltransferase Ste14